MRVIPSPKSNPHNTYLVFAAHLVYIPSHQYTLDVLLEPSAFVSDATPVDVFDEQRYALFVVSVFSGDGFCKIIKRFATKRNLYIIHSICQHFLKADSYIFSKVALIKCWFEFMLRVSFDIWMDTNKQNKKDKRSYHMKNYIYYQAICKNSPKKLTGCKQDS